MKIKVGQLVCLKSGGPVMTVAEVTEYKDYTDCQCMWFTEDGGATGAVFPLKGLVKIKAMPEETKMGFV